MIAMFKLFYNTIAACQRPVGPLLSNKCMYVCIQLSINSHPGRIIMFGVALTPKFVLHGETQRTVKQLKII